MLRLHGVVQRYGSATALSGVDLTVVEGVTGLVGVNGAGKSTLLTAAAGGLKPTHGNISIGGFDLYARSTRRRALGKVAFMPQSATFPGNMTALEVVEYVAWMRGTPSRRSRGAAKHALDQVLLGDRASSKIRSLSGGMRRRVCLAQAIVAQPDVLLLDEPSTGLDPEQRRLMVRLLGELDGVVLLSSHVMEDISDVASRVVVIDSGHVLFDGPTAGLQTADDATAPARATEAGFLALLAKHRSDSA